METTPLKRKRAIEADKRFAKIKADVAEMNEPPKLKWWLANLIVFLSENGFELSSFDNDDDGQEKLDSWFARASEEFAYKPRVDVKKAIFEENPERLEAPVLKAIAVMIDYLKGYGEGQFELIEENKKRIKQIQKAAKKVPKLNAARSDHVHIVANVMKYAEEEVVEDPCQAIEMFEDFLVDAQKAKILPA